MGTGKIKNRLLILILLLSCSQLFTQAEYIPYNHPIYIFLERMSTLQIIENYNSLERPITRFKAASFLREIVNNKEELNSVDNDILKDLLIEFEYDVYGTYNNTNSVFSGNTSYKLLSENESYIFKLIDSSKASIFVNLIGGLEILNAKSPINDIRKNASYLKYGGILRGTFLNRFGFMLKGTNGKVWGDRSIATNINDVKFSFKYAEGLENNTGSSYVDITEGYITADFDLVNFKFGREQKQIGFGPVNHIISDNAPMFDQLSLNFNYKFFNFSYFHGKLLGSEKTYNDSIQGSIRNITDKYISYHRLGFNINRHFTFGLGEMIVYSNRSIDFSYLNPFNFYKSVEHANQDRDNSILFLDFFNNSFKGLKLFGSVLIDDIDFGKLGSGWYGNQLLYNFTLYSTNLYKFIPVDFYIQYLRIDPYVYTHRIFDNNYTNFAFSLAAPLQPNSDLLSLRTIYTPYHNLNFAIDFSFIRHGANEYNEDGSLFRNVGGDILTGYRTTDATKVRFLDGNKEFFRSISLSTVFELYNNYFISNRIKYENNSFYNKNYKDLMIFLSLDIKI